MSIYTIYKVTNNITSDAYIGFTSNTPEQRLAGHLKEAEYTNHHFHNALRKYGVDNFMLETLYMSYDEKHTINIMEPHFIAEYNTFTGPGYNMTSGGDCGPRLSGKANGMYGKKHTKESIALMSQNRKGLTAGDNNPSKRLDVRKKISEKVSGPSNGMYGKKHTKEWAQTVGPKISAKLKGVSKKKVQCPHCEKIGGAGNMKRYHFDNCKV